MLRGQNSALDIYLVWPNWMEMKVSDREFAVGGNKFANLKPLPIRQILRLGHCSLDFQQSTRYQLSGCKNEIVEIICLADVTSIDILVGS